MLVLTVLPTATWPKSTVLNDVISVPVAVFVATRVPPHPFRAMLQKKASSTIKLNFKWRICPPNGRKKFIGARTRIIAKANSSNH
jgi:hypothetical protein